MIDTKKNSAQHFRVFVVLQYVAVICSDVQQTADSSHFLVGK